MTTDNWFAAIVFFAVYAAALLLLDTAHRAHIAELKHIHREQVSGLRTYIRTLTRERLWLEAELQRMRDKMAAQRQEQTTDVRWMPFVTGSGSTNPEHIQWPPSEEWNEDER